MKPNLKTLSLVPGLDPLLDRMSAAIMRDIDSPVARKVRQLIETQDWMGLAQLSVDPLEYDDATTYFKDVIPTFLKKCVDLPIDKAVRIQNTHKKWIEAEQACYRSNQRLFRFHEGMYHYTQSDIDLSKHIAGIRKIIASWIGAAPSSRAELTFTPGSTVSDRADRSTVAHKIWKTPTATNQLDDHGYPGFIGTLWHHNMVDSKRRPKIVRGGRYFQVPKKALIERPAEQQPSLNIGLQAGRGIELRRKLKLGTSKSPFRLYPGWDIAVAQEVHRKVAMHASVDQSFCTIDLSSASDMISKVLVEILLPDAWFKALDGLRTHWIKNSPINPKGWYKMEKFSSMGNGFTFELETIIFAAVACYVTRVNGFCGELGFDVFVFGDDIIVRDELFRDVKSVLEFFGFEINSKKSFHGKHPFRESCGGDYFNGHNVRGFNLEELPNDIQEIISLANKVKHCADRFHSSGGGCLNSLWFTVLNRIPSGIRKIRGPYRLGDTVLYDPRENLWVTRLKNGNKEILTYSSSDSEHIPWSRFDPATVLATAVLGYGNGARGIMPREPKQTFSLQWSVLEVISRTREAL